MSAVWLSYAPRVLLQHEFLTQKECAVLIKLAKEPVSYTHLTLPTILLV